MPELFGHTAYTFYGIVFFEPSCSGRTLSQSRRYTNHNVDNCRNDFNRLRWRARLLFNYYLRARPAYIINGIHANKSKRAVFVRTTQQQQYHYCNRRAFFSRDDVDDNGREVREVDSCTPNTRPLFKALERVFKFPSINIGERARTCELERRPMCAHEHIYIPV